jgi:hypothetical protein
MGGMIQVNILYFYLQGCITHYFVFKNNTLYQLLIIIINHKFKKLANKHN